MEVKLKKAYSCQLVLDLEKERQYKVDESIRALAEKGFTLPLDMHADLITFTLQDAVRRYCQMGVRRRWHDYMKELTRNVDAIERGEIDKVTMPELIQDVDAWSDEDKLVYKSMKEAEILRVKGLNDGISK